jgi:pyruvate-formate lyase-activating enzyme
MAKKLEQLPKMMMADADGNVFEHPLLKMAVASGLRHLPAPADQFIGLPYGADLHILPGRRPVGIDPATGGVLTIREFEGQEVFAVSAFLPPAHTVLYWSAFERDGDAPVLPLYAYAALGWNGREMVTPAIRTDPDIRQDLANFPDDGSEDLAAARAVQENPDNRLVAHLAHCCTVYRCPAARNLFLKRYEAPLPTSSACNANCVGCISLQEDGCVSSTQERIVFTPTAEEIAQVALGHIEAAAHPVVSFGQGCEGEPLTVWPLLEEAITLIRERTSSGTINLNTNASNPAALEKLFMAGLDSIRVSLNSARPDIYERYFRPSGYTFAQVTESMRIASRLGRFVSLNYFVFPGVTDQTAELEALLGLMEDTEFRMIQWRNLNIDPELYLESIRWDPDVDVLGVARVMQQVKEEYPRLRYGYFNPFLG